MENVIRALFPQTIHWFYRWHMLKKYKDQLNQMYDQHPKLKDKLISISHFNVLSAFDFVTAILMFCQIFYIYCQSFLVTSFIWLCVLQVYYLDNLLSNISVRAGTPLCQFFTSDVIDRISNLD
jgi:hypothetical protein